MKTDLAGFKKHWDEKILHNITSIESIDYDLRHDAVDLDNDINDLANNLSTFLIKFTSWSEYLNIYWLIETNIHY